MICGFQKADKKSFSVILSEAKNPIPTADFSLTLGIHVQTASFPYADLFAIKQ